MRNYFLSLACTCALLMASSCHLVYVKQKRLERFIRQQGLVEKFVDLDQDYIHYWEGGSGPPLLLVHGFGGDGTWGWIEQIEELSKHFHLIIPDLLWFGKSTSTKTDFRVEHQIVALKNLMNHLGIARYDVAGISYGGAVAFQMLIGNPSHIGRAVIISAPGPTYTREDFEAMLRRFNVQNVDELILPVDSAGLKRLIGIAYQNPPYIPWIFHQNVIDSVISTQRPEKVLLLQQLVAEIEKRKVSPYTISNRVLVIWGSDDPLFELQQGINFKKFLGDKGELKVIEGARHAPNLEFPEEFNRLVIAFLRERSR